MREVRPPGHFSTSEKLVFLAGSIEMGAAEFWQDRVVRMFEGTDFTVLNPRRDDWDNSWVQTKDNARFRQQVEWELNGLREADAVIFYFDPRTKAPITLLELGIMTNSHSTERIVVCPEPFYRKGNVDIVCERFGIEEVDTLEQAVDIVKRAHPSKITS